MIAPNDLCQIREKIRVIEEKSVNADYIYRGEPECYPKVSSSLYRKYEDDIEAEQFDLEVAQREMLNAAKKHIGDTRTAFAEALALAAGRHPYQTSDFELLTELQHYGGKTNLIDFTTDYFIALFFACDGRPDKNGRVILQETEKIRNIHTRPQNPRHRVIAQKSVFIHPPKGFIEPYEDDIVTIPAKLKQPILKHLQKYHGLSTEAIYNDIHGFIRIQNLHQNFYTEYYKGSTCESRKQYDKAIEHYTNSITLKSDYVQAYNNRGNVHMARGEYDRAIDDYTKAIEIKPLAEPYANRGNVHMARREHNCAIDDYTKAIEIKPDFIGAYYNRGEVRMHLSEWEKAKSDLTIAKEKGKDIIVSFRNQYESVEDFEQKNDVKLPQGIAAMLTPPQDE